MSVYKEFPAFIQAGDTALILAVKLSKTLRDSDTDLPHEVDLVRLLLAKGANPSHINKVLS